MGAWIETGDVREKNKTATRRTLMGAWIETPITPLISSQASVAPSWVRGLKLKAADVIDAAIESHPHGCVD